MSESKASQKSLADEIDGYFGTKHLTFVTFEW